MRTLHFTPAVVLIAAVLVGACDDSDPPHAPGKAPDGSFYPLSVGSAWEYHRVLSVQVIILDGPPPDPPEVNDITHRRRLTGTEERFGRTYTIEESVAYDSTGSDTLRFWERLRQDDTGLYYALVPTSEPPSPLASRAGLLHANASGTLPADPLDRFLDDYFDLVLDDPEEGLRLRYPLEVGAQWAPVEGQPLTATVEALDELELPAGRFPGYRIRLTGPAIGPEDSVLWWYGPCGRLRTFAHLEVLAMDPGTGEMARIITEHIEELRSFHLLDERDCAVEP